jgi:hypothetical protein
MRRWRLWPLGRDQEADQRAGSGMQVSEFRVRKWILPRWRTRRTFVVETTRSTLVWLLGIGR